MQHKETNKMNKKEEIEMIEKGMNDSTIKIDLLEREIEIKTEIHAIQCGNPTIVEGKASFAYELTEEYAEFNIKHWTLQLDNMIYQLESQIEQQEDLIKRGKAKIAGLNEPVEAMVVGQ